MVIQSQDMPERPFELVHERGMLLARIQRRRRIGFPLLIIMKRKVKTESEQTYL